MNRERTRNTNSETGMVRVTPTSIPTGALTKTHLVLPRTPAGPPPSNPARAAAGIVLEPWLQSGCVMVRSHFLRNLLVSRAFLTTPIRPWHSPPLFPGLARPVSGFASETCGSLPGKSTRERESGAKIANESRRGIRERYRPHTLCEKMPCPVKCCTPPRRVFHQLRRERGGVCFEGESERLREGNREGGGRRETRK